MDVLRPRQSPSHLRSHPIRSRDLDLEDADFFPAATLFSAPVSLSVAAPRRLVRCTALSMRLPLLLALFARCSALGSPAAAAAQPDASSLRPWVARWAPRPRGGGGGVRCGAAAERGRGVLAIRRGRGAGGGARRRTQNWMSPEEARALRADAAACCGGPLPARRAGGEEAQGDQLARGLRRAQGDALFFASKGTDGVCRRLRRRRGGAPAVQGEVATLKTALGNDLSGRPSLLAEGAQTHEMAYTRYGVGARLGRHTDEHHGALKNARPVASGDEVAAAPGEARAAERRGAERRALGDAHAAVVTWLVYLTTSTTPRATAGSCGRTSARRRR